MALIAGRPVHGWPKWSLSRREFRLAGAVCLMESAIVLALDVTRGGGIAFVTFALGALSMAAAIHLAQRRRSSI
jgi:hypothetical protein